VHQGAGGADAKAKLCQSEQPERALSKSLPHLQSILGRDRRIDTLGSLRFGTGSYNYDYQRERNHEDGHRQDDIGRAPTARGDQMRRQQSHDHATEFHAGGRYAQHGPAPFFEPVGDYQ
jgi:hypothetical protein